MCLDGLLEVSSFFLFCGRKVIAFMTSRAAYVANDFLKRHFDPSTRKLFCLKQVSSPAVEPLPLPKARTQGRG